ncbi:AbrB family transcriptional regulator [Ideonella sp. TBM-1]|uniref:AbrB family transcriptional regulator n=2 Tax=Ideonella livida TaxID=2707176 RepID=A0A7C9PGY4_9BURK|nr:AbrB family transcriptional regulator [Ideonella livida]
MAALAGEAAALAHVPLPWMIGPLLVSAALSLRQWPLQASPRLRDVGQWAIGTTLGLYFTPAVLAAMLGFAWAIGVGVVWALALGYAFYRFLAWRHRDEPGLHPGAAFFAAAIGGASEMALLAERHGAQVDRVAAAHSLRVLMVVSLIPLAFQFSGLHGLDPSPPAVREVHGDGLAVLVGLTVAAGLLMRRLDLPSPFVLGALAVSMGLTGSGIVLSALPLQLVNAGQLFIGVALGTRFTPAFWHRAPRWLASVALGTLGMIMLSAGFACALAWATGLHPATLILGTSPGGIAEMSITAKVLQLGVPTVTAFHVLRYLAVLLATGRLWRWEARRLQARAG